MALPAAVERAGQLADELYEKVYGKQGEAKAEEAPPQGDATNAAVAPTQPAPTDNAPTSVAKTLPPAPEETWESRFNVLNGKYSQEVPRYAAENRALRQEVGKLTEQVGTLTKQIEDVQSKVPTAPLISPDEVQEFGEPLVNMARRAGEEAAQRATQKSTSELKQVKDDLNDLKKSAAEIQWFNFIDLLTTLVPDWAQINVDARFLQWLTETDDLSGAPRQILLDNAKDARDATRAARFFTQWKAIGQQQAAVSRQAMEQQVVPDSSSRTVVPAGKQIITRPQIRQFYDNVRAGMYTPAEQAAYEAEIDAAMKEGRIR